MQERKRSLEESEVLVDPIPVKLPCLENPVSSSSSGWNVETIAGQHFIPCPECKKKISIVGRFSLIDHINESHPEKDWNEPRNRWHCQLGPLDSVNRHLNFRKVFKHMCTEHEINLPCADNLPDYLPDYLRRLPDAIRDISLLHYPAYYLARSKIKQQANC